MIILLFATTLFLTISCEESQVPINSTQQSKKTCKTCGGTGAVDSYVATFGNNTPTWCKKCGKMMPASHCHGCKVCSVCNGKGWIFVNR